jgi:uroporphyrinogen-III synthase
MLLDAVENQIQTGLAGLRVLSLESRRAQEMAKLISNYGGQAIVAPSMQEVPLESNTEALAFVNTLVEGGFDIVIFLTGVGTRALTRIAETIVPRETFVAALARVCVIARGPKPVAALRELGVAPPLSVPEPHTWRELLHLLDGGAAAVPLQGSRIAVQEYGASNPELLAALVARGAEVTPVPVYEWALPDNIEPLRSAAQTLATGGIDVVLFTTSLQAVHLLQIAAEADVDAGVRRAFTRVVVGSIGPVTSEVLRDNGIPVDFEPAHPKMGFLVSEAAQRARELLQTKRDRPAVLGEFS